METWVCVKTTPLNFLSLMTFENSNLCINLDLYAFFHYSIQSHWFKLAAPSFWVMLSILYELDHLFQSSLLMTCRSKSLVGF